jgi:MerR family copper efflux transcriptional regulator
MPTMTIGRLAKEAGVNIDTIRYYERNGLIPKPVRRSSGYREYETADVRRLRFIVRARPQFRSPNRELTSLSPIATSRRQASGRAPLSRSRTRSGLQRVRRGLKTLIDACPVMATSSVATSRLER